MSQIIFISSLLLLCHRIQSQNLISNPSFENNGQPFCEGWYDGCGNPFQLQCDSIEKCGTRIVYNAPPEILAGDWGVEVFGSNPLQDGAYFYATVPAGTYTYQLKFWANTENSIGEIAFGRMDNKSFIQPWFLQPYNQTWTLYTMVRTFTTIEETDTIGVWLTAGNDYFAVYDLIELTIIDTLTNTIDYSEKVLNIFPNPFSEKLNIYGVAGHSLWIKICNADGKIIYFNKIGEELMEIDMTLFPPAMYFVEVKLDDGKTNPIIRTVLKL